MAKRPAFRSGEAVPRAKEYSSMGIGRPRDSKVSAAFKHTAEGERQKNSRSSRLENSPGREAMPRTSSFLPKSGKSSRFTKRASLERSSSRSSKGKRSLSKISQERSSRRRRAPFDSSVFKRNSLIGSDSGGIFKKA